MTRAAHLAELEGQAYVVLRVHGSIEDLFRQTVDALRRRFVELPMVHPNSPHVTIRGYPTGVDVSAVDQVVDRWAGGLDAIALDVQRIAVFDAPAKIVILEIEKTPELRHAFTSLLDLSNLVGLPSFEGGLNTADAWTFHVSVLYGKHLSDEAWSAVRTVATGLECPPAAYSAQRAERVMYVQSAEHTRIVPFGSVTRSDESQR